MPRINIEDSLFKDPRWYSLILKCGDQYKALGIVATAWILAQKHWLEHGCIPQKAWLKDLDLLIETELAERWDDGSIYVKGSKKAFAWLIQRSEAGRKGGKKKAQNRLAVASGSLTEPSGFKPLSLSPSLNTVVDADKGNFSEKADQFISWWNIVAQEVRIVKIYKSPDNLYLIGKELAENPDMEYWKKALNGVYISEFHQGANKSGAKMNINWFFKNRTAADLVDHYETNKHLFEGILK
jgi:hypothetical protein